MILKIFASLLTGIGGHYLNRRWDKAILFLCLFVFYWAAAYGFFIFSLQNMSSSPNAIGQEFNNATQLLSIVSSLGIFILWLVSLIITFLDSKNKVEPNFIKWTKSGLTGATLTSILSFCILAITVTTFLSVSKTKKADTQST